MIFPRIAVLVLLTAVCHAVLAQTIDLAGAWRFRLDGDDQGAAERWYTQALTDPIQLPGMLQAQGYGQRPRKDSQWVAGIGMKLFDDPRFQRYLTSENFRCPFWLTPPRHYVGPAWYQCDVTIPDQWESRRVQLFLERPHWKTTLWIDDQQVGSRDGLGVPHEYDVTDFTGSGSHRLTLCVDNRYVIPVGTSAHSFSDETQGNWNGIVGRILLSSTSPVWLDNAQVYPNTTDKSVRVDLTIGNRTGRSGQGSLIVSAASRNGGPVHRVPPETVPIQWTSEGGKASFVYRLGADAQLWDEFQPALYDLTLQLHHDAGRIEKQTVTFGLRELGIRGTQFTLNGRPIFLRGTLECCIFPLEGHPPTDVDSWKRILAVAQAHGLNHLRFHSWCPPEAAYVAADEMGFYYQVECSCWAGFGDGTEVDQWVYEEAERMVRAYGNHPSFLLLSPSNEPHGAHRDEFLGKWLEYWKQRDPRRCYTAGAGWPRIAENQFHIQAQTRLQQWPSLQLNKSPQTFDDYRQYIQSLGVPTISHEIGQWCVYPNVVSEPEKYTGFFRGGNLEAFRDILQRKGMFDLAEDFLMASGKFQTILYKQEIESALRTPGMAGFQLLDLHDFPGQGTAPVGVLDAFWQSKGYVSPEEYRRFCSPTVLLARLKKLIWTSDEALEARIDVAHYGPVDMESGTVHWTLLNQQDQTVASGTLPTCNLITGRVNQVGRIRLDPGRLPAPAQLKLVVCMQEVSSENDWTIWVYPPNVGTLPSTAVHVLQKFSPELVQLLASGERVLLMPPAKYIASQTLGTFQPIFWNRITFPSQKVHTLGILCDPQHPVLAAFPTDWHSNWQWQDLLDRSKPVVLDDFPPALAPLVQVIDDWNNARKLAVCFEARVGGGKLLWCSIDLSSDLRQRPAARQLLHSLIEYMDSDRFNPAVELSPAQLLSLQRKPRLLEEIGATATSDSQNQQHPASLVIDGDLDTMWHTEWNPSPEPHPHSIIVDLKHAIEISAIVASPRQDMTNGRIAQFQLYLSTNGRDWQQPVATGTWPNSPAPQRIELPSPTVVRYVKLVALSEVNGQRLASLAELEIVPAPISQ